MLKLYSFCLSIAYIARPRQSYIESTDSLIIVRGLFINVGKLLSFQCILWRSRCSKYTTTTASSSAKTSWLFLTTEWLPWLHTSWRHGDYERFTLVLKTNCIRQSERQLPSSSYNHNTLTKTRTSVQESLQMQLKFVVRSFHALVLMSKQLISSQMF